MDGRLSNKSAMRSLFTEKGVHNLSLPRISPSLVAATPSIFLGCGQPAAGVASPSAGGWIIMVGVSNSLEWIDGEADGRSWVADSGQRFPRF